VRQMEYDSQGTVGNRGPTGRVSCRNNSSTGQSSNSPVIAAAAAPGGAGGGGAPSGAGGSPLLRVGAGGLSPYSYPGGAVGAAGGSVLTTAATSAGRSADWSRYLDDNQAEADPIIEEEEDEDEAKEPTPDRWTSSELQTAISSLAKAIMKRLPSIRKDGTLLAPGARPRDLLRPPKEVAAEFNRLFPGAPLCQPAEQQQWPSQQAREPHRRR